MDHSSVKKEIRKRIKAERAKLTPKEVMQKSAAMLNLWQANFPLEKIKFLHLFISMKQFNEPDTTNFIRQVESTYPSVNIVIPITDFSTGELRHQLLLKDLKLEKNHWGIPEPVYETEWVQPSKIDMVLVPMLAFGTQGHRIGFGKGFYDRFLARTRPDCLKIGLSFELSRLSEPVPAESTDIPLDFVITEREIISWKKEDLI